MATTFEEVLRRRSPGRIVDVVARLEAIGDALPPQDGVAAFNRLYLEVTRGVLGSLQPGRFQDGRFLRWLDVVFANLYFEALRAFFLRTGPAPRAWAPLVEQRAKPGILPLQFAFAGMNAHINRDLPVAIVDTCRSLRTELRRPSPQYDDFCRVNDLLEEAQERIKDVFARGAVRTSTPRSAARTTCSRCGKCARPARPRGRMPRCCGPCADFRTSSAASCARSTAPWASPGAGCSSPL